MHISEKNSAQGVTSGQRTDQILIYFAETAGGFLVSDRKLAKTSAVMGKGDKPAICISVNATSLAAI